MKKLNYVETIRQSFLREFANNKAKREAEEKQKPFASMESEAIKVNLCLN